MLLMLEISWGVSIRSVFMNAIAVDVDLLV